MDLELVLEVAVWANRHIVCSQTRNMTIPAAVLHRHIAIGAAALPKILVVASLRLACNAWATCHFGNTLDSCAFFGGVVPHARTERHATSSVVACLCSYPSPGPALVGDGTTLMAGPEHS